MGWKVDHIPIPLRHQRAMILPDKLDIKRNITNWTETENSIMDQYFKDLCEEINEKDKATLIMKMEGSTFTKLKRSLRVSFTDKLGSIGGTLGLFSGFSLLAIVELIHWICKIMASVILPKVIAALEN